MNPNTDTSQNQYNPVSNTTPTPEPTPSSLPGKSNHMTKWVTVVVTVLVVGSIVAALALHGKSGPNNNSTSNHDSAEAAQLSKLASKGSKLTSGDLSSFNATDLFFAIFRNAAQQQNVVTTRSFYQTANLNDQPDTQKVSFTQVGFNYKSKQLTYQDSTLYPATGDTELDRCVGGKMYSYMSLFADQGWQAGSSSTDSCSPKNNIYINDGINTGGLSASQASQFVNALRSYSGYVTVDKTSMVSNQGKPYVRFDVSIHQRTDSSGDKLGIGYLLTAFGSTGLDVSTWPYYLSSAQVSQAKIAYFVDPTTQLPVYAQIAYTPVSAGAPWDNDRLGYSFAALPAADLSTANAAALNVNWPVETLPSN